MTTQAADRHSFPAITINGRNLLFSLSSFIAAAITLVVSFAASLPRPWWALLTVYVTAQPMAGAFRPKAVYRLAGIAVGAGTTLLLVPNLQNSPELLVLCLAAWTGLCIYLAVLDRTPRAFLFQMAAFSSAVISFPYLDDPTNIFDTTISRVEEMTVAILCVTAVHGLLQPWSAAPVIRSRIASFIRHAARWSGEALSSQHTPLEYEHRRVLAADITEIGMMAVHLPFDDPAAPATRNQVTEVQHLLAEILPLASAASNRLDLLREQGPLPAALENLRAAVVDWLGELTAEPASEWADRGDDLARQCAQWSAASTAQGNWSALLGASAAQRMAGFVTALVAASREAARIGDSAAAPPSAPSRPAEVFPLARDHGLAFMAGLATACAIAIYCAIWITLAWPNGSATAAFAALITCSFAAQDDPAPVIGRYLLATLKTFPLAAFYLFVVLPRADGAAVLILTLAPALVWMGYIQADPLRSPQALPMFSCFIVAMGFLARFQGDFAVFVNTGLAQVGGIVTTLAVTRLFRSANSSWTAHRIVRANWADLARLANIRQPFGAGAWSARATDRLGQVAARMTFAAPEDALHAADGLGDLRIGRNIIPIRRAMQAVPYEARHRLSALLGALAGFYDRRWRAGRALPPEPALVAALDAALAALIALPGESHRRDALAALVGMRCNLFPAAAAPQGLAA